MSFYQPLSFPADADSRRHERHAVTFAARVRELGATAQVGQVNDLSIAGCRVRQTDLPQNAEIWIAIGGQSPVRARVVWARSGQAGCEFYAPLSRAELRAFTGSRF